MLSKTKQHNSRHGLLPTPVLPKNLPDAELTENALQVLIRRYVRRDEDGQPAETVEEMFWRVAYHVAKVEETWGGDVSRQARDFYEILSSKYFFPNSPTFTGAGTPLGQLAACFTAGMHVTTEQGVKPIAELKIGERVLTHAGRYRPVIELHQRAYAGELLRIKIKLIGTTLEVTPEHPILTPNGWMKAQDLSVHSRVAIGVPRGVSVNPQFDLAALPYAEELEVQTNQTSLRVRQPSSYQNSGRQANWNVRFIEVSPDLARLCGYYVSEGTIGPDERYIRFTFNKDEVEYHEDVRRLVERIFGLPVNVSQSSLGNWININVYSRALAAWFETNFGHGSSNKHIPLWLQYAETEIQNEFLIGLMRGDGLYYENMHLVTGRKTPKLFRSLRLTLSNPALIQQVWQVCLRLGYDAAVRPVDTTYVTPNASDTAQISLPPLQSRQLVKMAFGKDLPEPDARYLRNTVTRQDDQVFFEVQQIESVDFAGTVYNCEVDEDHSYVTEGVVVHNCFVLPISDDMGRDSAGIFQTLRDAALIQQTGGGNGFSFSRLRPKNSLVKSSAGQATGPVGFLRVYDKAFGEIAQGGSRRGANMAVLRVDHPDIEEFITCKTDEKAITNFNISVGITDAFMQAVQRDDDWELRFPDVTNNAYRSFNGTLEQAEAAGLPILVHKRLRARELFDKIVQQAHHNGEPGVLFLDAANRANPVPQLYQLESTNPCGEQFLGAYENCCLGSINLAQHFGPGKTVDWAKLQRNVELSTRFLDDVVEANAYVPAVPQLKKAALTARRIGLGIMGLADLMYHAGIRYGSPEGQEFAAQVMEFVRFHAMQTSIELARVRGPFPALQGSIYDPQALKWSPPMSLIPYSHDWGRPAVDWTVITDGIRQHGIRNAAQTTVAPTGTIATVAGCEGYGCEPVFALAYIRHVNDNGKDLQLSYASPLFDQALREAGIGIEARETIVQQVLEQGSCQGIEGAPEQIRNMFVVSQDISAEEHVRMQAALQAFVDNSLSKTVNFGREATVEDVATAYKLAWELGCKGITVYVTGSREKVVLETRATASGPTAPEETIEAKPAPVVAEQAEQLMMWHEDKKPRPRKLPGYTFNINTPLGKAFVTINENGGEQPFEVFINTAKAGSDTAAVSEAIGRLVSYILRLVSPVSPRERLREVWRQLVGIGGGRSLGFGPNRVRSLPDGVAQALSEYLEVRPGDEAEPAEERDNGHRGTHATVEHGAEQPFLRVGDLCPECGQAAVVNEEGCRKCYACGYSEC